MTTTEVVMPESHSSADLVMTPMAIEARIRSIAASILKGADIVDGLRTNYTQLKTDYDLAFAKAAIALEGPKYQREWQAEVSTHDLRQQLDVAYTAYRHGADKLRALESELRAYQSVGASIRAAYQTAGRGEF
jgi:hypothetical protein